MFVGFNFFSCAEKAGDRSGDHESFVGANDKYANPDGIQRNRRRREYADSFLDSVAKEARPIQLPARSSYILEQVVHLRKPFLVCASTEMLLVSRFINSVPPAIVMSMQSVLIIPS